MIECCANCKYLVSTPKNNRYKDVEHFCLATGYFAHGINKDRNKIKHFTLVVRNWNVNMKEEKQMAKILTEYEKKERENNKNYFKNGKPKKSSMLCRNKEYRAEVTKIKF